MEKSAMCNLWLRHAKLMIVKSIHVYNVHSFIKYQTFDIEVLVIWLALYSRCKSLIYPIVCPNMETENFYHLGFSLKMAENSSW